MAVLPGPVEFLMGSPVTKEGRSESEPQRRQRIGRTFAVATKPVSLDQFLRFRQEYNLSQPLYAPTRDCPAHAMGWYLAAEYCNWLSDQDGIARDQQCYEPNAQGKYSHGMKLKQGHLSLSGYRLPTEAEWEYACRAGTTTSTYFGESPELLGKYAVYVDNSHNQSWPVGSLKPNDFGLFDMNGNVWCWCEDRAADWDEARKGDSETFSIVNDEDRRSVRGGSFFQPRAELRSALRKRDVPTSQNFVVGFRPARTLR
jgi:formylglycine-generating enzyme required for sulfatase activity